MQEQLNAYKALYEVAKQHGDLIEGSHLFSIEEKLKELELSVEFNIELHKSGTTWYTKYMGSGHDVNVGLYSEEQHRQISWSDDGRQPENEWLCVISFPTGAYIFGDYLKGQYPLKTFNAFFEELKSFGTKYCDTNNHNLYYTSDVGYKVVEAFPAIFKKYKDMSQHEYERQRVKELKAELAKLKGE